MRIAQAVRSIKLKNSTKVYHSSIFSTYGWWYCVPVSNYILLTLFFFFVSSAKFSEDTIFNVDMGDSVES